MTLRERALDLVRMLPSEHGFWVMVGAAQGGALLRTSGASRSWATVFFVVVGVVAVGSASHRLIRKSGVAQLMAAGALALSSVPVEMVGALPLLYIVCGAVARGVVFLASALVVRAAFARSARGGERRSRRLSCCSVAIPALVGTLLFALHRTAEASTCVIAGGASAALAWTGPTVK